MPHRCGRSERCAVRTGIIARLAQTAAKAPFAFAALPSLAANAMHSSTFDETGYAPVNGLRMYYEIHGLPSAVPLVLLHGGGDTIETSFGQLLPTLARARQVIAFEQQGCGRTADIADRSFSFEQSADDTAGLLEYLNIDRADLLGFSNGGTVALQVAIRHPHLVRRLVVITALMKRAWADPQFWESMKTAEMEAMPAELREAYLKVAPHPENLESFFYKARNRMRDFNDAPDDVIRAINAPTLVIGSDRDVMRPEGAVELFRLLPYAELLILPGTDHMRIPKRTEWLVPMINEFLEGSKGAANVL
jgi:pimeloyl-ACP methyl ester carboxylesterase